MIKSWLTALLFLSLVSGGCNAQTAFVEGSDFETVSPPVQTSQPDKVVVTELFWYGCPHCFRFEPYVERWSPTLPAGVVFEQVPSTLSPRWAVHAHAYYAFEMMGILDQIHRKFFDALHLERKKLYDLDSIAGFIAAQGFDEKAFREHVNSFPVQTRVGKNGQKEKRYGSNGVPTVIVNGKYRVTASLAGSNERMIEVINFLINQELQQ